MLDVRESNVGALVSAFSEAARTVPNYIENSTKATRLHEQMFLVLMDGFPILAACVLRQSKLGGIHLFEIALSPPNIKAEAIRLLISKLVRRGVKDFTIMGPPSSRLIRAAIAAGFELVDSNNSALTDRGLELAYLCFND